MRGGGRGRGGKRTRGTVKKTTDGNDTESGLENEGGQAIPANPVVVPEKASKIQKITHVDAALREHESVVNQAQLSLVVPPRPVEHIPRIDAQILSCFGGFSPMDLNALDYFFAMSTLHGSVEISRGLLILSHSMRSAIDQHNHVCKDLAIVNERLDIVFQEKTDAEQESARLLVCCLIYSTLCLFFFVLMG
jgi:hypothetical protein